MYNFVKKGALLLFAVALALNFASCEDDCEGCEAPSVTPPTVTVAPNTLSGVITHKDGNAVAGATVTLKEGVTTTTDAQGVYKFDKVAAGTYLVTVTADDQHLLPAYGQVVIANSGITQHAQWNFILMPYKPSEELLVQETETEVKKVVETEALPGNEKAEIQVDLVLPTTSDLEGVEADADVKMTVYPIYQDSQASAGRAIEENTLMVGSVLGCSHPDARLKAGKFVELIYNLDAELAQLVKALKWVNGKWVAADFEVQNDQVVVKADEFTAFGLFLNISFNETTSTQNVEFDNEKWDNLYGAKPMEVKDVTYSYQTGIELALHADNVLSALLIEKLAQRFGSKAVTLEGSYPVNVTLPIGTKLIMSGSQQVKNVTASVAGLTANAQVYGHVSVKAETYNRDHVGGSN